MKSARLLAILFTLACAAPKLVAVSQFELATLKARAAVGDNSARYKLGAIYELAAEDPADAEKLLEYFRAGAEAGHAACMGKFALYRLAGAGSLKQDEAAGLKMLQEAAALKDPFALVMLAEAYAMGWFGLAKDIKRGAELLDEACKLGSAIGLGRRSYLYEDGISGYPKDEAASKRDALACAVALERTAADLDAPRMQMDLYQACKRAKLFNDGKKWLDKAIQAGSYAAISERGISHMWGLNGETKDLVQAYAYFNLAASIRPEPFPKASSMIAENRDMLAKEMTGAQIAEAQRLSTELNAKIRK
jgi:TPR repeat protein